MLSSHIIIIWNSKTEFWWHPMKNNGKLPDSSAFLDSKLRSLRREPCCWSTSSTTDATEKNNAASVAITWTPPSVINNDMISFTTHHRPKFIDIAQSDTSRGGERESWIGFQERKESDVREQKKEKKKQVFKSVWSFCLWYPSCLFIMLLSIVEISFHVCSITFSFSLFFRCSSSYKYKVKIVLCTTQQVVVSSLSVSKSALYSLLSLIVFLFPLPHSEPIPKPHFFKLPFTKIKIYALLSTCFRSPTSFQGACTTSPTSFLLPD